MSISRVDEKERLRDENWWTQELFRRLSMKQLYIIPFVPPIVLNKWYQALIKIVFHWDKYILKIVADVIL